MPATELNQSLLKDIHACLRREKQKKVKQIETKKNNDL